MTSPPLPNQKLHHLENKGLKGYDLENIGDDNYLVAHEIVIAPAFDNVGAKKKARRVPGFFVSVFTTSILPRGA